MNITTTIQRNARQFMQSALLGTWAKLANGKYQRCTGEVVERKNGSWHGAGCCWQSAYAAMSHIDYKANN